MAIDKKSYTNTKHTGIKVHKDGLRYWFDFTLNGKRYSRLWKSNINHTKVDKLKSAYSQLESIKAEILHATTITADMGATVNDYFDNLKSKWKVETLKKYEFYYEKYMRYGIGKLKVKEVKPAHFTSFNKTIAHLAPSTRKRAYEILQPLFRLAIEDEIIVRTPIKTVHIPVRNQLSEKKVVTDAVTKFKTLHKTIHDLFADNPHHRAIFLFGFYGRRLNEALTLHWNDIDLINNQYTVRGKNSKINTDMTFSLAPDVKDALLEFTDIEGEIFNISEVQHYYKTIREHSGIEEFTFHWMRNLSVSALSSMGADLTHLTAMLGHTDSSTLKKYLSLQREASTAITNDLSAKLLEAK
ncbi:MAG TPA: hypothetical protein EYO75_03605 [Sulfurimonas sp.]|nr:hypothetical protein [Sulfurimonas sp.]HIM74783.1 hypothetical protein [Campylobacterales bacterium]